MQKKYLDYLKETENMYKQTIKEQVRMGILTQDPDNQVSTHLYKIKHVVKRITIEGEHTYLMLLKID